MENSGWYILSPSTDKLWSEALIEWNLENRNIFEYIYVLKNSVSEGSLLTLDNWKAYNIKNEDKDIILNKKTAYFIYVLDGDYIYCMFCSNTVSCHKQEYVQHLATCERANNTTSEQMQSAIELHNFLLTTSEDYRKVNQIENIDDISDNQNGIYENTVYISDTEPKVDHIFCMFCGKSDKYGYFQKYDQHLTKCKRANSSTKQQMQSAFELRHFFLTNSEDYRKKNILHLLLLMHQINNDILNESNLSGIKSNNNNIIVNNNRMINNNIRETTNIKNSFYNTEDTEITCLIKDSVVKVIYSGGNKYLFNGLTSYDANRKYGMYDGVYTFKNISSAHPMAIIDVGIENTITYSGDPNKKSQKRVNGIMYNFYHGDMTVNVNSNFNTASVYCLHHGYMGGDNILNYTSLCDLQPQPEPEMELKAIDGYDYRRNNNGSMEYTTTTLIVTNNSSIWNPSWYASNNATVVNWEEGIQIPTSGTHIVRDSRFLDNNGNLKTQIEMEPYIAEYLSIMNSSVCVYEDNYGTIYIREAVDFNVYWIYQVSYITIYYDNSKINELWGVNDHEDILIPFITQPEPEPQPEPQPQPEPEPQTQPQTQPETHRKPQPSVSENKLFAEALLEWNLKFENIEKDIYIINHPIPNGTIMNESNFIKIDFNDEVARNTEHLDRKRGYFVYVNKLE